MIPARTVLVVPQEWGWVLFILPQIPLPTGFKCWLGAGTSPPGTSLKESPLQRFSSSELTSSAPQMPLPCAPATPCVLYSNCLMICLYTLLYPRRTGSASAFSSWWSQCLERSKHLWNEGITICPDKKMKEKTIISTESYVPKMYDERRNGLAVIISKL